MAEPLRLLTTDDVLDAIVEGCDLTSADASRVRNSRAARRLAARVYRRYRDAGGDMTDRSALVEWIRANLPLILQILIALLL